jgi:hypothetical protein
MQSRNIQKSPYVNVLAEESVLVSTFTSIVFALLYDFFNIYVVTFTAGLYKTVGIV